MFNRRKDIFLAWLPVIIFTFCFVVLFAIGTIYDLKISRFLTNNSLPKGENNYLSKDIFGVAGEIFGVVPIFLLFSFAGVTLFYFFDNLKLKRLRTIFKLICVAMVFVGYLLMFKEIFGYVLKHVNAYKEFDGVKWKATSIYDLKKYALYIVYAVLSLLFSTISIFAGKAIPKKMLKKLAFFVILSGIVAALSLGIVEILKIAANRPRFRTLHALGDESKFRRWYEFSAKPKINSDNFLVILADKTKIQIEKDGYKSFPSGHTAAAAMTFSLMLLPELLKIKNKEIKLFCYEFSIIFTAAIAISRVVAGAHYLTDVLIGGTIPFLLFMLFKEIFISKCKNFKRMVGKYTPVYEEEFIEINL